MAGRGTDHLCAHLTRVYWTYVASLGKPGAELFIDVIGAFDAVIRGAVIDHSHYDDKVATILSGMVISLRSV